jgi:hypothetical protein
VPEEGHDDLPVVLGWRGLLENIAFAFTPEGVGTPGRVYLALPGAASTR